MDKNENLAIYEDDKYAGIILPSKTFKDVIDKTVDFLVENGDEYINSFLENEEIASNFPFLKETHPFYQYFKRRHELRKANIDALVNLSVPKEIIELHEIRDSKKLAIKSHSENLLIQKEYEGLFTNDQIAEWQFYPSNFFIYSGSIANRKLRVLLLCAKYSAVYGMKFITYLVKNYANRPNFDFINPKHEYNKIFLFYISAFKKILFSQETLQTWMQQYSELISVREKLLKFKKSQEVKDTIRAQEKEAQELKKTVKAEETVYNWFQFELVSTVRFTQRDAKEDLPAIDLSLDTVELEKKSKADQTTIDREQLNSDELNNKSHIESANVKYVKSNVFDDEEIIIVKNFKKKSN